MSHGTVRDEAFRGLVNAGIGEGQHVRTGRDAQETRYYAGMMVPSY